MTEKFMSLKIAITYGEALGLGPEILRGLFGQGRFDPADFVLFGSRAVLDLAGLETREVPSEIEASFEDLSAATRACLSGECRALVTGPIDKTRWHRAGVFYTGQTEVLSALTGAEAEMLFVASNELCEWRVLLLTRHIPLREVSAALTAERIEAATLTARGFLSRQLGINNPKIAIAGINPHAGDGGSIGGEEILLEPILRKLEVSGCFSPDALWVEASRAYLAGREQAYDLYLAPYHDQILPLIKTISDFRAINVSIGLPFIRTSPDHGVGYSLVGTGKADWEPFAKAIEYALRN